MEQCNIFPFPNVSQPFHLLANVDTCAVLNKNIRTPNNFLPYNHAEAELGKIYTRCIYLDKRTVFNVMGEFSVLCLSYSSGTLHAPNGNQIDSNFIFRSVIFNQLTPENVIIWAISQANKIRNMIESETRTNSKSIEENLSIPVAKLLTAHFIDSFRLVACLADPRKFEHKPNVNRTYTNIAEYVKQSGSN